jgi:pyrroline-5-carboxylate reductase
MIVFVGGGHMASALIAGLRRSQSRTGDILVIDPNVEQHMRLERSFGVKAMAVADATLERATLVVWAVKPQALLTAAQQVVGHLGHPLHVSIAAGIPTDSLVKWLRSDRVIRVMPNMPAILGRGVSGMFGTPGIAEADRALAEDLFTGTGHVFWVDSDERIDAVTALSGSGPGYVFEFLASFERAALSLGFTPSQCRELVLRTVAGALAQAESDDTAFSVLRDRVTSKGGTTAAGLEALARRDFSQMMSEAVDAAFGRARELSANTTCNS